MSTIRETIETAFASVAFAERDFKADAQLLMQGDRPQTIFRRESAKKAELRPRPTLHAK